MALKKLNTNQELEILKLYGDGLTITKIAQSFNVGNTAISRVLKKNNIETRNNSDYNHWEKLSGEQEQEIIRLYQENIPSTKIAKKFGIDKGRVVRILRRENIEIKSPASYLKKLDKPHEKEVIKLYSGGLSISEIARQYKVNHGVINKILVENNIAKKDPAIYNRKFSKAQEQDVIELYSKQKLSVNKIAQKFNVEIRTVSKILKVNNVKVLTSKEMRKLTDEQEKEMIKLYRQRGYSTYQLAEEYNITRTSVKRIFTRHDVEIINTRQSKSNNAGTKIKQSQYPKIISLYKGGLTQEKIGQLYDVGEETIRKILQKNNVVARKSLPKLNKKQEAEIVKLYQQDFSTLKLAKQFDINKSSIKNILEKNNVVLKPPGFYNKKLIPAQEAEIIQLYQQGLSITKVSQKTNIDSSTIKLVLKRNNIEIKPGAVYHTKVNPEIEKEIIRLFKNGSTIKKIAETLALSPPTISIILKRNGIEIIQTYQHLKKVTEESEQLLAKLYQDGLNMKQISEIVKHSPITVSKLLKKLNLESLAKFN